MSSASGGSQTARAPPGGGASSADSDSAADPLIPLEYCDAPNQRFYAVSSFGILSMHNKASNICLLPSIIVTLLAYLARCLFWYNLAGRTLCITAVIQDLSVP